jgi:hypothetical protein
LQVEPPPPLDIAQLRIMQETAQMAAQAAAQMVQQMAVQQAAVQQAAVQQAAVQQAAEVRNTHTDTRACKSCI